MTINLSDNNPRVSYAVAQGATQTSFTVSFEFFDNDDLNVYVDGTLKTITTHYTVSGGNGSTGTITMSVTGATGGSTVVITRDIDLDRTTDFPSSGPFNIGALNTELDRLVAIAADLNDLSGRGVKLSDFDTGASLTLPVAADRGNKVLAFNSTGDTLVSQELGTFKGNWAASTAYVERDLVKDTSDGSIYIVNTAHTSSGSLPLDTNTNSSKYDVIFNVDEAIVGSVTASGNFTINGNTTLGNATSDTITATGRLASSLVPNSSGNYFLGNTSLLWGAAFLGRVEALDTSMTSVFEGPINAKGNVTIGNSANDTLTVNSRIDTNVVPSTDNAVDLGASANQWRDIYVNRTGFIDKLDTEFWETSTLGAAISSKTGQDLSLYGDQGIRLDIRDGDRVILQDGGNSNEYGSLKNSSGNLIITTGSSTTTAVTFGASGIATFSNSLTVTGALSVGTNAFLNGNVHLGNASSDTITVNGQINSDIIPAADSTHDLGTTSVRWANIFSDDITSTRITSATLGNTSGNTTIDASSGIILDSAINIELDASSGNILFRDDSVTFGRVRNTSGDLIIDSGTTTAVTFSGANATLSGTLDVSGDVTIPDKIVHTGDTNTAIRFPATDTISFETAGSERFRVASSGQLGIAGANYGTSGQVLTSGGSSAAPSWANPSLSRTVISTTDVTTAVANVDITLPTSGYRYLEIHLNGILPSASSATFEFNLSTDAGSSFLTSLAGNYAYMQSNYYRRSGVLNATDIEIADVTSNSGGDGIGTNGIMRIDIGPTSTLTTIGWNIDFFTTFSQSTFGSAVAFNGASVSDVFCNLIRFKMSTGNISDGNIRLYGIA